MRNFLTEKKHFLFIILGFLVIAVLIMIIAVSIINQSAENKKSALFPSPYPQKPDSLIPTIPSSLYLQYSEQYKNSVKKINEQEKEALQKDFLVHQMQLKLPYSGQYFTASYTISDNLTLVVMKKGFENEGSQEFDEFLKKNGVLNIDWIRNLKIITE